MLSVKGVSRSYGQVRAVEDISFDVHEGEVLCLVGDNGAGKSTVVKMIAGLVTPNGGDIEFRGGRSHAATPVLFVDLVSKPFIRTWLCAATSASCTTWCWAMSRGCTDCRDYWDCAMTGSRLSVRASASHSWASTSQTCAL